MPTNSHRKKSLRKSIELRTRNRAGKSKISTQTKKVLSAVEAKDADTARTELKVTLRLLDRAVTRGFYHQSTVARKKSALNRKVNELAAK